MDESVPTHLRFVEVVALFVVFILCTCVGRWCSRTCVRNQRFSLMDDVDLTKLHARYKLRSWGDGLGDYRLVQ